MVQTRSQAKVDEIEIVASNEISNSPKNSNFEPKTPSKIPKQRPITEATPTTKRKLSEVSVDKLDASKTPNSSRKAQKADLATEKAILKSAVKSKAKTKKPATDVGIEVENDRNEEVQVVKLKGVDINEPKPVKNVSRSVKKATKKEVLVDKNEEIVAKDEEVKKKKVSRTKKEVLKSKNEKIFAKDEEVKKEKVARKKNDEKIDGDKGKKSKAVPGAKEKKIDLKDKSRKLHDEVKNDEIKVVEKVKDIITDDTINENVKSSRKSTSKGNKIEAKASDEPEIQNQNEKKTKKKSAVVDKNKKEIVLNKIEKEETLEKKEISQSARKRSKKATDESVKDVNKKQKVGNKNIEKENDQKLKEKSVENPPSKEELEVKRQLLKLKLGKLGSSTSTSKNKSQVEENKSRAKSKEVAKRKENEHVDDLQDEGDAASDGNSDSDDDDEEDEIIENFSASVSVTNTADISDFGSHSNLSRNLSEINQDLNNYKLDNKQGIIYLNNVPHGFYEREMKGFFSQFGEVLRLRVARSKKTFKSKGYAYVQFKFNEVAKIVQQTMNKYILFGQVIECELMEPSKVHDELFHPGLMRKNPINWRKRDLDNRNKVKTVEQQQKKKQKLLDKDEQKRQRLKELGIDYDFVGYK